MQRSETAGGTRTRNLLLQRQAPSPSATANRRALVLAGGLEPPTPGFGGPGLQSLSASEMVETAGVEPAWPRRQPGILPLDDVPESGGRGGHRTRCLSGASGVLSQNELRAQGLDELSTAPGQHDLFPSTSAARPDVEHARGIEPRCDGLQPSAWPTGPACVVEVPATWILDDTRRGGQRDSIPASPASCGASGGNRTRVIGVALRGTAAMPHPLKWCSRLGSNQQSPVS